MPSTAFDTITLIHDDGRIHQITDARAAVDGDAAKVYVDSENSPSWAFEGMELVIGDGTGSVLFAGQVLSIDSRQRTVSDDSYSIIYRCLGD